MTFRQLSFQSLHIKGCARNQLNIFTFTLATIFSPPYLEAVPLISFKPGLEACLAFVFKVGLVIAITLLVVWFLKKRGVDLNKSILAQILIAIAGMTLIIYTANFIWTNQTVSGWGVANF